MVYTKNPVTLYPSRYDDVTWKPTHQQLDYIFQQLVKYNILAPQYWPTVLRGIRRPMDSPRKGPVMWDALSYNDVMMFIPPQGGIYLLTLIDWYGAAFPPLVVALLETLLLCYVYGEWTFELLTCWIV